jgi:two-component system, response regulator RegA
VSAATRTLFLVDDDEANRLTLSALLEDEGFEVLTAGSFAECRARLPELGRCVAALLDQRLGDGDGLALAPLVRAVAPGIKLLLLTGNPEGVEPSAPVDAVLAKGVGLKELLRRLEQLLG